MVLVALVTVGTPAVADVDPAVMAMLREWSLASPNPWRVVIWPRHSAYRYPTIYSRSPTR
jgi:hypothetical protein